MRLVIAIARQLAEKGHRVVCADRSQKRLQQARQAVPGARFKHSELEQLDIAALAGKASDCGRGYDAVVFWDAIFHLPRQAHRAILEKVIAALATGGQLIVSSGGSEQDLAAFTDTMFGVSFYYDAYSRGEFLPRCQSMGFSATRYVFLNEPDGLRDKARIAVVLAKA